jgi:hypothetical protein
MFTEFSEEEKKMKDSHLKNIITAWLEDLAETGFGYDNGSDFDNEAELNGAMAIQCNWYAPADKYIYEHAPTTEYNW